MVREQDIIPVFFSKPKNCLYP